MYSCDLCEYKSRIAIRVEQHKLIKHENLKFGCDLCDFVSGPDVLARHKKSVHEANRLVCQKCEFKSNSKSLLDWHMLNHQTTNRRRHDEPVYYKCYQCGYSTLAKEELTTHKCLYAGKSKIDISKEDQKGEIEGNKEEADINTDKDMLVCFYGFEKEGVPINDPKLVQTIKMLEDQINSDNIVYHCTTCDFESTHQKQLANHTNLPDNCFKYKCTVCEYKTSYQRKNKYS